MFKPIRERSREDIIQVFIVRAAPADRPGLSLVLNKMTLAELDAAYEALQAQTQLQKADEKLAEIAVESEAERIWYQESVRLAREPQRLAEEKQQLEADRKTFIQAAKSLRSFSLNAANFNVTRSILSPGFSAYDIQQALGSNALQLSPATQAELSEWTREAKEAEIQRLKNMDLSSLRKLVRDEGARIVGQQPAPDETQRVRQEERNDGAQYPPLPEEFLENGKEVVLDAAFIKRSSRETYKLLLNRYGSAQITEALRTRVPGNTW